MRASMSTWRLLEGTAAEDVDRAVTLHLASSPPKGLIGAFDFRTGRDTVTVVVVDAGGEVDALDGVAEKLAGRAERPKLPIGPAQDLIALGDDGRVAFS